MLIHFRFGSFPHTTRGLTRVRVHPKYTGCTFNARSTTDLYKYTSAGKYTICFFQLSHFFTRCTTHTAYTALVGCLAIAYKSHAFETCYCTAFHIPMDTTVWENWMECLCMCACVVCDCCTIFMNMEIFQRMPFTQ